MLAWKIMVLSSGLPPSEVAASQIGLNWL